MKSIKLFLIIIAPMFVLYSHAFAQETYYKFSNLNNNSVNVGNPWVKLATGRHSFQVNQNGATVEAHVNTRISMKSLNGNGIWFRVRLDDSITPDYDNLGSFLKGNTQGFVSIFAVFKNIPQGSHRVSIWAKTPRGSASSVIVDNGGWGGAIVLKVKN